MLKISIRLLLLTSLLSTSIIAAPKKPVATVTKLRGRVTQLAPGEKLARVLKVGQQVREDTSIVTKKDSFAKVEFKDGSILFIGPKSKAVVVRMDRQGNGIVGLLKGKIRSKINSKLKKKFYIQTRNAAIGVRGTEFETVYNPENNITSLITYKGKVAMATLEGEDLQKNVERTFDNKIVVNEKHGLMKNPKELIENSLEGPHTVIVKSGQLSQTVDKFNVVSQPIQISPIQVNAIYKNSEYRMAKRNGKKLSLELDDYNVENQQIKSSAQKVSTEGVIDSKNKIFAAKAGGLFDLETGLYIPPKNEALFDQKNQVFAAQGIGLVDSATGSYRAPLGLVLDPREGFKERGFKKNAPQELVARVRNNREDLNANLAMGHLIRTEDGPEERVAFKEPSAKELISKNTLSLAFITFNQDIDHSQDTYLGGDRQFDSEGAKGVRLSLAYASTGRWQPTSSFTMKKVPIPAGQRGAITQSGEDLVELAIGMRYLLNPRWTLLSRISLSQDYILHHTSDTSGTSSSFIRVTTPKIDFGLTGVLYRSGHYSLETGVIMGTNLPKETGDHKLSMGHHADLDLSGRYWFNQKFFLRGGLNYSYQSNTSEGNTEVYTSKVKRSGLGAFLILGSNF